MPNGSLHGGVVLMHMSLCFFWQPPNGGLQMNVLSVMNNAATSGQRPHGPLPDSLSETRIIRY